MGILFSSSYTRIQYTTFHSKNHTKMTDSPRHQLPIDPDERPIEGQLLQIRNALELLKQDKSCYVKSCDIIKLYKATIEQVRALNELRARKDKKDEQNRVDTLCDDCFQLISLGFMAIGKNNDAPAIYSTVSSIKRLLDHLQEAAFYSSKDLEAMKRELEKHHATLQRCQAEYDPELIELIERRIAVCEEELEHMQKVIHHLTPELAEDWEKLVSILRRLSNLNTRSRYSEKEHAGLKKEIAELEKACPCLKKESPESITTRYNEIISHQQDALNQPPEQLVMDLHERCVLWSSIIENKPLYVDPEFRELYKKLKGIRDSLESRSLLQAWSLRETDLYDFQRQLDRIDESRTLDGNFVDASGKKACLQTQRTLLYFLRKSYALIYMMLTHSEPVSEALLPIYNQLKTLKKCLQEVKKAGGVSSPRELYPYSMKLNSIDNMQVDGKFMVNGDIPDGQAAVISLLHDCYELAHQLKEQAEENEAAEEESGVAVPTHAAVPSAA